MMNKSKKSSSLSRYEFLAKTGLSLAGISAISISPEILTESEKTPVTKRANQNLTLNRFLKKGQKFNESVEFADKMTGRACRQLTQFRTLNQQPTYHINACFSADSRYLVLTTIHEDGSSSLLRAEVLTGEITVIATLPADSGEKYDGNQTSMMQACGWVACNTGKTLRIYNPDTLEERILIENVATGFGHPIGSIDGKKIFIPRYGQPDVIKGYKMRPVTHLQVDIESGEVKELFTESEAQCNHVVPCPGDPDLLLIDRDWPRPPEEPFREINSKSRVWVLNIKTKQLSEIRPDDVCRFQIHSNWSFRGEYVYYHGTSKWPYYPISPEGHFIGVADKKGKVIWEGHFPTFFYGHVGSHTRGNIIITDALFTKNLITAIHWEERNSQNIPKIEILAQHDTNWAVGQTSHPHPHVSPDGKWLSYNRGEAAGITGSVDKNDPKIVRNIYGEPVGYKPDRSDVCVVRL